MLVYADVPAVATERGLMVLARMAMEKPWVPVGVVKGVLHGDRYISISCLLH